MLSFKDFLFIAEDIDHSKWDDKPLGDDHHIIAHTQKVAGQKVGVVLIGDRKKKIYDVSFSVNDSLSRKKKMDLNTTMKIGGHVRTVIKHAVKRHGIKKLNFSGSDDNENLASKKAIIYDRGAKSLGKVKSGHFGSSVQIGA